MRARSWMAALALVGTTSILIGRGLSAHSPGPAQEPGSSKAARPAPEKRTDADADAAAKGAARSNSGREKRPSSATRYPTIQLNLVVAGLGTAGCDVEVKPANAGCKFRPSKSEHVNSEGRAAIKLKDVELRGADRTCTMAITIREPGQPAHTIYRGFRPGSSKSGPVPSFTCFISSRLAEVDSRTTTRK